ncbi:aminoglycoside 3-N-acetyltransferase [Paenibacillus phyllosphaerae]|uniref:Aminoglycoside N(3)-acetyltransferase n=1 Tax=Paenibacillus phyllosphaerae TaxID=274593 RepID=A0A7W5B207_9BACL|nr:AAC(3) family N-acetyltransferase [Paenibacillus phyllosphaerae]MBB3112206.1 aminoglycoside 3-N-acetyltransferase [Paenibacillus phyllosphaerae]
MSAASEETRVIWTRDELVEAFRNIGLQEGQTVFVHTSLRSLGYVVGGAETLIRALLEVVGIDGTIMMPSQTWKNLDPQTGVHWEAPQAWWPIIREHWPAYDKALTPAIGMSVVAEMFRKWPGAMRSDHPARSVAAVGKHAAYLTEGHDLSCIFGPGSPVDKLYGLDGHVLLIGVGHDKNTSLHLAETRADFPSKTMTEESSAILVDGKRRWVTYSTQAVDDSDFVRLGEAYEREKQLPIHRVGHAEIRFMRQRELVDWATAWMERNRA